MEKIRQSTWDVSNLGNNGINYQPQLVSRISSINSIANPYCMIPLNHPLKWFSSHHAILWNIWNHHIVKDLTLTTRQGTSNLRSTATKPLTKWSWKSGKTGINATPPKKTNEYPRTTKNCGQGPAVFSKKDASWHDNWQVIRTWLEDDFSLWNGSFLGDEFVHFSGRWWRTFLRSQLLAIFESI